MRWLSVSALLVAVGCGQGSEPSGVPTISVARGALAENEVKSVSVLVLSGETPTCTHALTLESPLFDPAFEVLAHGLFAFDGTPRKLARVPLDRQLVFYGEAFATLEGTAPRLGRACVETTLSSGATMSITLTFE